MAIFECEQSIPKKVHPLIGILLFLISIVLLMTTGPIGLIYGFFYKFTTKLLTGIGDFCLEIAIAIDQLGNVLMQHLLNQLWITADGYKFGNRDETISSVIGKNLKTNTLTRSGRLMDKILDIIEPGHSLNSIDYFVEPLRE